MTGSQAGAGAWRPALVWAALGGLSYAASLGLARWPGFTEAVYANGLGPLLTRPLSRLTGVLPFAVGELLASIYLVGLVTLLVHASLQVLRRRRSFRAALGAGVRRVLLHAGVLATLFYVLWGFNYARAPFLERSGWPEWSGVEAEELARREAEDAEQARRRAEKDKRTAEDDVIDEGEAILQAIKAKENEGKGVK